MTAIAQRNFSGGELAPALHARTDTSKYQNGAETIRNMTIMRSGGVQNRPGFELIDEVLDSSKEVRIFPFILSNQNSFVFEFGEETLRVFKDGAKVTKLWHAVVAVTNANPCYVTVQNPGIDPQDFALIEGSIVTFQGLEGTTELNGNSYKIKNITHPGSVEYLLNFSLTNLAGTDINSSAYGVFVENSTARLQAASAITGISKANPCVLVIDGNGYQPGDEIAVDDIVGMTELNGRSFRVSASTVGTVTIEYLDGTPVDSTNFTTYVSGGTTDRVLLLPTPYQEDELVQLQFSQDRSILVIAHATYVPKQVTYYADDDFGITNHRTSGGISSPTILTLSGSPGSGYEYVVTAIDAFTGEESPASLSASTATAGAKTLEWTAPSLGTVRLYNVYKKVAGAISAGIYGLVGSTDDTEFIDNNFDPDLTINPPFERDILDVAGDYPSVVGTYQTRRLFGASVNAPETTWASRINSPTSFQLPTPIADDDPVTFTLAGPQYSQIRHFVNAGSLVLLTNSGEWAHNGDQSGALTPSSTSNVKQYDFNGASLVRPVVAGGVVIFVQANGSIPRSFGAEIQADGYRGTDLSTFSTHLFDDYTLAALAFQRVPNPIVWAVRSDGVLLGMTYLREHEIWGWHRHDSEGTFKDVCVVPEGKEDRLYAVVEREIDGVTKKYIERMTSRVISADGSTDAVFLDCHLSYSGTPVSTVGNLWHLEGADVAIIADGHVIANPLREDSTTYTVENGQVTLPGSYSEISVGLPYISDLELLDIDTAQGESLADRNMLVNKVTLKVEKTRGMLVGPAAPDDDEEDPLQNLDEPKLREDEPLDDPTDLKTGNVDLVIAGKWSKGGKVFVRQIDPLPMSILSVTPHLTYARAGGN